MKEYFRIRGSRGVDERCQIGNEGVKEDRIEKRKGTRQGELGKV